MLSINYTQIKHLSLVLKKQDLLPNASGEGAGLAWLTSAISSVPHNKLDVSKMSALVIPMEVYPNLAQLEALKKRVHRCLTEKCLQARCCFHSWQSLLLITEGCGLRDQDKECSSLLAPSTKEKGRQKQRRRHRGRARTTRWVRKNEHTNQLAMDEQG